MEGNRYGKEKGIQSSSLKTVNTRKIRVPDIKSFPGEQSIHDDES